MNCDFCALVFRYAAAKRQFRLSGKFVTLEALQVVTPNWPSTSAREGEYAQAKQNREEREKVSTKNMSNFGMGETKRKKDLQANRQLHAHTKRRGFS